MSIDPAPVINPADLAAIISKSHSGGFAPFVPQRSPAGIVAGTGFQPANYEVLATQAQDASDEKAAALATPREKTPAFAELSPPAPKPERDVEAELAAAFEKGRESGLMEGRGIGSAEAEARLRQADLDGLATARDAFLAAASALSGPQDHLAASLCDGLEAAILRLAAERAGMAIAENPAAFLVRVSALAERVAQGVRQVRISLHPDDLAQISAHLGDAPADLPEFLPKADLSRGDVIVTAPGISLSDLLLVPHEVTA